MEPVIALDSDAYVTMLERDVAILHKAEDDLKARSDAIEAQRVDQVAFKDAEIERLTGEYKDLFTRSEELSTKLWQAEQRNSELGVKDSEIERLTSENNALRDQGSDLSARLQESEMKHAELQQEQKTLREELDLLKVRSADADSRRLDAYEFARISSEQANGLRRELEILRRDIGNALDRPTIAAETNFEQRHKDIVGSMERLFLGTDATHALARDPLIDRIARLVLELREQRERADHLTREIGALQEFQRHAEDWHRQLLRIRKSFSWRVTAPIRGLTRPFRRPH
jgi:myosin heavy subunit